MKFLLKRKIASWLYRSFEFFSLNIAATHKVTLSLDYRRRWREFLSSQTYAGAALWIHGASVGELEDLAAFFTNEKLLVAAGYSFDRLIVTSSSPSAESFLVKIQKTFPLRYAGPLPPDVGTQVTQFFAILKPDLLVLSQSDTWPVLLSTAAKKLGRGAVWLPHKEESAKWSRRSLLEPVVKTVALRRADMKSPLTTCPAVFVGSPRVDRILERVDNAQKKPHPLADKLPAKGSKKFTVLLASAWKEDGQAWAEALKSLEKKAESFEVLVVPHDIHDQTEISALSSYFGNKVILKEGILLESYKDFNLAFVGGGFRTGLHNVVEPLAWGVATLCGKHTEKQPEAARFMAEGALTSVKNSRELAEFLGKWLADADFRAEKHMAANRARDLLSQQRGASGRLAEIIRQLP